MMLSRAKDYNNAGVTSMRANQLVIAFDLFKGALEVQLAYEKRCADPSFVISEVSRAYIACADAHHCRMGSANNEDQDAEIGEEYSDCETFCNLFKFRSPVRIEELPSPLKSSLVGLTIIFNLALLEHVKNSSSKGALSLYRLADSLLTSDMNATEARLAVYILNNIGVWFFENGDMCSAEYYIGHLADPSLPMASLMSRDALAGIEFNLDWFANPRYQTSPAA
jgi:hypothetical protein